MVLAAVLLAPGCGGPATHDPRDRPAPAASTRSGADPLPSATPGPSPSRVPADPVARSRPVSPDDFRVALAEAAVRHLAGTIGPRHGTSPAFARAADWVAGELEGHGYDVGRQRFAVPGGDSWGVPVPAGTSVNVVATPEGFDPGRPHLVVGAHLDTVPHSPGAEDNASGVGVLLAAAHEAAAARTRLPVVWVAFGAEEPRGPTDDDHHYGSRAHVAALTPVRRRALRAMVSLDRVGVGDSVPVGSAQGRDPVQQSLLAAARRAGVAAHADAFSRSSDHWSFVREGLPAARLGSTPYAGYHSPADLPAVLDRAQLRRTGRLLLAWLAPSR